MSAVLDGPLDEDALTRLLERAGTALPLPADGPARVLEAARAEAAAGALTAAPGEDEAAGWDPVLRRPLPARRPRRRGWRPSPALVGGGLVAAAVVGLGALVISSGSGSGSSSSASSASSSGGAAASAASPPAVEYGPQAAVRVPAPAPSPASQQLSQLSSGLDPGAAPAGAARGGAAAAAGAPGVPPAVGPSDTSKVVHTGQVTLAVGKGRVPAVVQQATAAVTGLGGYVQQSDSDEGGSSPTATLTLRVPAASFDLLVQRVRALGEVVTAQTGGKDVTGAVADYDARLRALRTQRDTYLTILSKAGSVNETLSVQQRVDAVQTQIEQLTAEQKALVSSAAEGTLALTVGEKRDSVAPPPPPAPARSGLSGALHDAWSTFRGGLLGLVAASGGLALALLALLVALAAWRLGRRAWRRRQLSAA